MASVTITPITSDTETTQTANNDQEKPVTIKEEKKDDYEDSAKSPSLVIDKLGNATTSTATTQPICIQLSNSISLTVTRTPTTATVSSTSTTISSSTHSASKPKPVVQQQTAPTKETAPLEPKPPPIDHSSICGCFGWTTVGNIHLPFILRGEGKYISVRMVESKIISRYTRSLPWITFACAKIKSYYITENEAKLFNEINGFHCDFLYGKDPFTTKDVVVHLEDTILFYEFIETCRTKMYPHEGSPHFRERFGFLRYQGYPLPYLLKAGKKQVPSAILPQDILNVLNYESSVKVGEWDLPYFRFLSYVTDDIDLRPIKAGGSMYSLEELSKVSNGITLYFEEWWPPSPLKMISRKTAAFQWERPPIDRYQNPHLLDYSGNEILKLRDNNVQYDYGTGIYPSHRTGRISIGPPTLGLTDQYGLAISHGDNSLPSPDTRPMQHFPPPPPLVRLGNHTKTPINNNVPLGPPPPLHSSRKSIPLAHHNLDHSTSLIDHHSQNGMESLSRMIDKIDHRKNNLLGNDVDPHSKSAEDSSSVIQKNVYLNALLSKDEKSTTNNNSLSSPRSGNNHHLASIGQQQVPPPHYPTPPQSSPLQSLSMMPSGNNGGAYYPLTYMDLLKSGQEFIDLCSPPPSPDLRVPASSQYLGGMPDVARTPSSASQPFSVQLVSVDEKLVPCVNFLPHRTNQQLMVSLHDATSRLFPSFPPQSMQYVLQNVLGVRLYECSLLHQHVLSKQGGANCPANDWLVSLADLKSYLPQLRYIICKRFETSSGAAQSPPSKRHCLNNAC